MNKPNLKLRTAVRVALGRFHPSRVEEAFARIDARIKLDRHIKAMNRMQQYVNHKIAKDPNPHRSMAGSLGV